MTAYRDLVRRASEEEPVAYLTGRAHFFNLEFHVTRDVLIPRPDTETLVENVIQLIRRQSGLSSPRILDLCTGSGCIAAAIAQNTKEAVVVATDISEAAVDRGRAEMFSGSGWPAVSRSSRGISLRRWISWSIDIRFICWLRIRPTFRPAKFPDWIEACANMSRSRRWMVASMGS